MAGWNQAIGIEYHEDPNDNLENLIEKFLNAFNTISFSKSNQLTFSLSIPSLHDVLENEYEFHIQLDHDKSISDKSLAFYLFVTKAKTSMKILVIGNTSDSDDFLKHHTLDLMAKFREQAEGQFMRIVHTENYELEEIDALLNR